MPAQSDVKSKDSGPKGRYVADGPGVSKKAEPIIADHAAVPDKPHHQGLSQAPFKRLIQDARAKGRRMVPLRPLVRSNAKTNRKAPRDVIQF